MSSTLLIYPRTLEQAAVAAKGFGRSIASLDAAGSEQHPKPSSAPTLRFSAVPDDLGKRFGRSSLLNAAGAEGAEPCATQPPQTHRILLLILTHKPP